MTTSQFCLNLLVGGSSLWFFQRLRAMTASTLSSSSVSAAPFLQSLSGLHLLASSPQRSFTASIPVGVGRRTAL